MTAALRTTALPRSRRAARGPLAWVETWRQRRALARLDAAALRDIGLTEGEALAEQLRPVWDVPATWRI